MRQIFPLDDKTSNEVKTGSKLDDKLVELNDKINDNTQAIDDVNADLQNYKSDMSSNISTGVVSAAQVNTPTVDAGTIKALGAKIEGRVDAQTLVVDYSLTSNSLNTNTASATDVNTNNLKANNKVETKDLTATTATISSATITNLSTSSFSPTDINATDTKTKTLTADSATITTLSAGNIGATKLNATDATVSCAKASESCTNTAHINNLNVRNILHCFSYNSQYINSIGIHYILLPRFTNGNFYLEAQNDGGKRLWSVEVANSINNVQFRWSEYELGQLTDVKISKEDGTGIAIVQLKIHNTEHIRLYYQSQSTMNSLPPSIYTTDQLSSAKPIHTFTELTGTFISDIIYTNKLHIDQLETDYLLLKCGGYTEKLFLTCNINKVDDLAQYEVTNGDEYQYIANKNICGTVVSTWNTPADRVTNVCSCLTPTCVVAQYDGTVRDPYSLPAYPITNLGNKTCVHGEATVQAGLTVCDCLNVITQYNNTYNGTLVVGALPEGEKLCGLQICKDGNAYLQHRGFNYCKQIITSNTENYPTAQQKGCPMIWAETGCGIAATSDLHVSCTCTNKLTVSGDANIAGDLYVAGTLHTVVEDELSTGSDTIMLRQGNNTSLANGEFAGILVNKYNGTNTLAYGTDNAGQFRIGHVSGTQTTCNEICSYDGKWYVETTVVSPTGELTSWNTKTYKTVDNKEYTVYTNAVFTTFSYTNLQPALTREETTALNNKGILCWNSTNKRAEDLAVPTVKDSSLYYNGTDYYWDKKAGVYHFATIAAYNAKASEIPDDSIIAIDSESDYMVAEAV